MNSRNKSMKVFEAITPSDKNKLKGMFDCQFSLLPQRAYVWLVIGAPRAVVSQLLCGFYPRFINNEKPEPIIVRSKRKLSKTACLDMSLQDAKHAQAGRITMIPASERSRFVHSIAARFPLYQDQPDARKLRIIYDARILNFRLPERAFSLPTVKQHKLKESVFQCTAGVEASNRNCLLSF